VRRSADPQPTPLTVTALPGRAPAQVVVDLRRVTHLGEAGIAALDRTRQRCEARGARFVVRSGRTGAVPAPHRGPGLPGRCAAARPGVAVAGTGHP
jgi:hypothetical protein